MNTFTCEPIAAATVPGTTAKVTISKHTRPSGYTHFIVSRERGEVNGVFAFNTCGRSGIPTEDAARQEARALWNDGLNRARQTYWHTTAEMPRWEI